jgi:hypothetical protein
MPRGKSAGALFRLACRFEGQAGAVAGRSRGTHEQKNGSTEQNSSVLRLLK